MRKAPCPSCGAVGAWDGGARERQVSDTHTHTYMHTHTHTHTHSTSHLPTHNSMSVLLPLHYITSISLRRARAHATWQTRGFCDECGGRRAERCLRCGHDICAKCLGGVVVALGRGEEEEEGEEGEEGGGGGGGEEKETESKDKGKGKGEGKIEKEGKKKARRLGSPRGFCLVRLGWRTAYIAVAHLAFFNVPAPVRTSWKAVSLSLSLPLLFFSSFNLLYSTLL